MKNRVADVMFGESSYGVFFRKAAVGVDRRVGPNDVASVGLDKRRGWRVDAGVAVMTFKRQCVLLLVLSVAFLLLDQVSGAQAQQVVDLDAFIDDVENLDEVDQHTPLSTEQLRLEDEQRRLIQRFVEAVSESLSTSD